jgi:hypothetical protein
MRHVARVEIRFRPGAAGVFPLGLGGQTITVGREITNDARTAAAVTGVKSLLPRQFIAELHRVVPAHIFDGQVRAFEFTGIAAHHGLVLLLRHFGAGHQKGPRNGHVVDGLFIRPSVRVIGDIAHAESPGGDERHQFRIVCVSIRRDGKLVVLIRTPRCNEDQQYCERDVLCFHCFGSPTKKSKKEQSVKEQRAKGN